MDLKFLKPGLFCCDPLRIHKKKISKDIGVVTRNLLHRNPAWNLTSYQKECSTSQKLIANQIGKSTHFWKINIFVKTAVFIICFPKSLNMRSERGNIKECNKYPRAILNIRRHGGQKRNSFLFCSNFQHNHS